ncbi:MAG: hypothetical protein U5Q03_17510 [Bacteroidota bacterium]|nr:hypothetical protein [Bacteroidota bacterium]
MSAAGILLKHLADRLLALIELVRLLKLCTFNNRLTMGSPVSPALSNFAMISPDLEMLKIARGENVKFTRYVDDLTFSGDKPITSEFFIKIENVLKS